MEDIYDRSKWPSPDSNPLVMLLLRGDEWFPNIEVATALSDRRGGQKVRSPMANWPRLQDMLTEKDSMVEVGGARYLNTSPRDSNRGGTRYFSRRAVILICLRAQTVNAAAFRDWLASRVAGELANG